MKQLNNRILIVVLAVLAGIFIVSKVFRSPKRESNLSNAFVSIDTSRVMEIRITKPDESLKLVRNDHGWTVQNDNKSFSVHHPYVKNLLGTISNMSAQKLVARNPEKWNDYGVGDSTGIQVVILEKETPSAHWFVGKQGSSVYMRTSEDEKVYAVTTSIHSNVSRAFNEWRDKTFLKVNKDNVSSIQFKYPSDSSFTLEKKENGWMIGTVKADSASVEKYLNRLSSKNLSSFADDFTASRAADVSVEIKNKDNTSSSVQAWYQDSVWVLTSSRQEGVFFSSEGSSITDDLFAGKGDF